MIIFNRHFKNEKLAKIVMAILLFFIIMLVAWISVVKAEDNKTTVDPTRTAGGFPKILDDGEWSSQLVYDTVGACYQGTIRWIILSNPSLVEQIPGPWAQRQMVEHCFCVMDKVRKEIKLEDYRKKVFDQEWTGNLFMVKAVECVQEWETLPSFFTKIFIPDNETKKVIPEESGDSKEELPSQKPKESEEGSTTTFQG